MYCEFHIKTVYSDDSVQSVHAHLRVLITTMYAYIHFIPVSPIGKSC